MKFLFRTRVKSLLRCIGLIHFVVLLGIVAGPYASSATVPIQEESPFTNPAATTPRISPSFPPSAFAFENQLNANGQVPAPVLKDHVHDYSACHQRIEQLLVSLTGDYLIFSGNINPGFPKIRIPYPFHNFW